MARKAKPGISTSASKMRKRASLSNSRASRVSPFSTLSTMLWRISSSVSLTSTPSATDRPTAGSASMARIFLSGQFSTKSRTIDAQMDVFPTPPFPATVMIRAFSPISVPPIRKMRRIILRYYRPYSNTRPVIMQDKHFKKKSAELFWAIRCLNRAKMYGHLKTKRKKPAPFLRRRRGFSGSKPRLRN